MPLLTPPRDLIQMPVADRRLGDTVVRQLATFVQLRHVQELNGECSAVIALRISLFAAAGEGFGPALAGPGFSDYMAELRADNNCLVVAQTGKILAVRGNETEADWLERCNAFAGDTMLQGDFFRALREGQAVKIGEMIRQYIQNADAAGKFC